jgi:hypothetical protein
MPNGWEIWPPSLVTGWKPCGGGALANGVCVSMTNGASVSAGKTMTLTKSKSLTTINTHEQTKA